MESDPFGHPLIHHFGQANPKGPGQDHVPSLLRRVADTLEGIDGAEVMDLVLHNQINEDGDWYSLVVYYALPADDDRPPASRRAGDQ